MKKVKWLLAGAGDIASRRAGPALMAARDSELLAICDLDEGRASKLAEALKVERVFKDYGKALFESGADAVYIATPAAAHVGMCLNALEAGKHFLCEKPLGVDGEECVRLLDAVRKSDRVAGCSNYRRLSAQCKLTDAMLKRNEIGSLAGGWAVYSAPYYNPGKSLGGPIKELGFYLIDIALNLFGMPSGVMAQASCFADGKKSEDMASIIMKFPSGALFTISLDWRPGSPGIHHELEIFGSVGRIRWPEWPPHGDGPIFKTSASGTERVEAHTGGNYHLPMVEDFVSAVINGCQPLCSVESGVRTAIVTDAVFRSIENGKLETVEWKVCP